MKSFTEERFVKNAILDLVDSYKQYLFYLDWLEETGRERKVFFTADYYPSDEYKTVFDRRFKTAENFLKDPVSAAQAVAEGFDHLDDFMAMSRTSRPVLRSSDHLSELLSYNEYQEFLLWAVDKILKKVDKRIARLKFTDDEYLK